MAEVRPPRFIACWLWVVAVAMAVHCRPSERLGYAKEFGFALDTPFQTGRLNGRIEGM